MNITKRYFKRSSESESNIHNNGNNILNFSSYLEEIRIQSPNTGIISEKTMSEKQFRQKRQSMVKEIRGSRLVPKSEFLNHRKTVIDNILKIFESFKHGNTEDRIQVSNCKENLKGENYFENIHENYVLM